MQKVEHAELKISNIVLKITVKISLRRALAGLVCKMKYVELTGTEKVGMPLVGLGTWRAEPQETENTVLNALKCGYRHIGMFFFLHFSVTTSSKNYKL